MGGGGGRWAGAIVLIVLMWGCREPTPPAYVRLDGPAPSVEPVPPARALLVVFWASWCEPCRAETPSLRDLADAPPRDLAVVVYGHDEAQGAAEAFLGTIPPSWNYRPDGGRVAARAFGVDTLPASVLVVDRRLVARFAGPRDWASAGMRDLLNRLIAETPTRR